jgi:hypothetical protein
MTVEAVYRDDGQGRLRITGRLGHVLHETDPIAWDTKDPITRAEIVWAVAKTGISHADLYDAVRQAQRVSRRAA